MAASIKAFLWRAHLQLRQPNLSSTLKLLPPSCDLISVCDLSLLATMIKGLTSLDEEVTCLILAIQV